MLSMDDIWAADLVLVGSYVLYAVLASLSVYSLFKALRAAREGVSWGQARVMGVPFALFVCIQVIFYLVVVDAAYGLVGLIVRTPLWLDVLISLGIIALAWWLFWRLSKRRTFKRGLFVTLVMIPLGVPGAHVVGQVAQVGAIEVSQKVGIGIIKYGDSLDGLALRNVDDVVEAVPIIRLLPVQLRTVAGDIDFRNSIEKGLLGDALTARRLTGMKFTKLASKYNSVNGIDGIYAKFDEAGNPIEVIIVENKVGSGRLAPKQMSNEWVLDRLARMKASGDPEVRRTADLISAAIQRQPSVVHKELWRHDLARGTTVAYAVDSRGKPGAVLRKWDDRLVENELLDRCRRQVYQCSP